MAIVSFRFMVITCIGKSVTMSKKHRLVFQETSCYNRPMKGVLAIADRGNGLPILIKEWIMPLISVPALYDGKQIRLLEVAPVQGPYRVLVTFIEPAREPVVPPRDLTRFWASFGAWQDERPIEETLRDIHEARRSRTEPPAL